jgi:hypothetical protein
MGANDGSGISGLNAGASAIPGLNNAPPDQGAPTSKSTFVMTDGWYVAIACIGGVMVADTKVGPIAFGILTLALIYQLTLLLQGK